MGAKLKHLNGISISLESFPGTGTDIKVGTGTQKGTVTE